MAIQEQERDPLSFAFAALAHPARRAILERLALGEADVTELVLPFGLSQPTITKHLRVLERAGLVLVRREAQRRPRALLPQPLKDVSEWVRPFAELWEQRFSSLDSYLQEMDTPTTTPIDPPKEQRHAPKKR
ncbi:metalloregulator ArsR/SmtB family transcription factor [Ramlibacter sp.]|uniref:ArsR/SmtB family transcription factor n=1 Tax=Ramlibacter sp. TaxID=1917967 RepID=UPI001794F651|nr:metalloregulator ArsR/SmtB family transcription factor [Ramlibacter sp.]MBA2676768.1 winged helix-turn-helix transcriptional regulator [Ramlibacter sp.]